MGGQSAWREHKQSDVAICGSATVRSVRRSRSPPLLSFKFVQSPACTSNRIFLFKRLCPRFGTYLYRVLHPTAFPQHPRLKHGLT